MVSAQMPNQRIIFGEADHCVATCQVNVNKICPRHEPIDLLEINFESEKRYNSH